MTSWMSAYLIVKGEKEELVRFVRRAFSWSRLTSEIIVNDREIFIPDPEDKTKHLIADDIYMNDSHQHFMQTYDPISFSPSGDLWEIGLPLEVDSCLDVAFIQSLACKYDLEIEAECEDTPDEDVEYQYFGTFYPNGTNTFVTKTKAEWFELGYEFQ